MGTRAAYGFISDGIEKITYCHSDGYVDGLGVDLLKQFSGCSIELLTINLREIKMIKDDQQEVSCPNVIAELSEFYDNNKGEEWTWYSLLRGSQGNIDCYLSEKNLKYMIDNRDFLYESLFCEYAYIINLDTNMFEFYTGFNEDKNAEGRYAMTPDTYSRNGYYGVKLIGEVPLDILVKANDEEIDLFISKVVSFVSEEDGDEEVEKVTEFPIFQINSINLQK